MALRVDALIIGGGPAGLSAALVLQKLQCDWLLISKPISGGEGAQHGRFVSISPTTLEFWRILGVDRSVREHPHSLTIDSFKLVLQDGPILTLKNKSGKFAEEGGAVLTQTYIEQVLRSKSRCGGGGLGNTLLPVVESKYVLVADGAKSTVRSILEIPSTGYSLNAQLTQFEVQLSTCLSESSSFIIYRGTDHFILFVPIDRTTSTYRLVSNRKFQKDVSAETQLEVLLEQLSNRLQAGGEIIQPLKSENIVHHTQFVPYSRRATQHVVWSNTVFLIGDALCSGSPVLGKMGNLAVRSAVSAAWRVGITLRYGGIHNNKLFSSHETEISSIVDSTFKLVETATFIQTGTVNPSVIPMQWMQSVLVDMFFRFVGPAIFQILTRNELLRETVACLWSRLLTHPTSAIPTATWSSSIIGKPLPSGVFLKMDKAQQLIFPDAAINPDNGFSILYLDEKPHARTTATIATWNYAAGFLKHKKILFQLVPLDFSTSKKILKLETMPATILVRPDGIVACVSTNIDEISDYLKQTWGIVY